MEHPVALGYALGVLTTPLIFAVTFVILKRLSKLSQDRKSAPLNTFPDLEVPAGRIRFIGEISDAEHDRIVAAFTTNDYTGSAVYLPDRDPLAWIDRKPGPYAADALGLPTGEPHLHLDARE